MPVSVAKHSEAHGKYKSPHWHVKEKNTGIIKGHSKTLGDAQASARVRNAVTEGGFKPTKRSKK